MQLVLCQLLYISPFMFSIRVKYHLIGFSILQSSFISSNITFPWLWIVSASTVVDVPVAPGPVIVIVGGWILLSHTHKCSALSLLALLILCKRLAHSYVWWWVLCLSHAYISTGAAMSLISSWQSNLWLFRCLVTNICSKPNYHKPQYAYVQAFL